jgi:hypothetical protein
MTVGDLGKENLGNKNRILACGVELSSIKQRHYDIKTGDYSDIVLPNIQFVIGAGEGNEIVSGEALFFPKDRGVSLIMGRQGDCDVKIDLEIIAESEKSKEAEAAQEAGLAEDYEKYEKTMENWVAGLKKEGLADLHYMMTTGDDHISRYQLQISRHPDGSTVATSGTRLGSRRGVYKDAGSDHILRSFSNQASILRNYSKEPVVHEFQEGFHKDSYALNNGDVIVIKGRDRQYCFRFFEEVGEGGLNFKQAMMIKQSYPLSKPIKEIHQELMDKGRE